MATKRIITQTGTQVVLFTQNVSKATFAIYAVDANSNMINMANSTSYTLYAAIDTTSALIADSYYYNFSSPAQATANNLGKFAISVANLGGAAGIAIEWVF